MRVMQVSARVPPALNQHLAIPLAGIAELVGVPPAQIAGFRTLAVKCCNDLLIGPIFGVLLLGHGSVTLPRDKVGWITGRPLGDGITSALNCNRCAA